MEGWTIRILSCSFVVSGRLTIELINSIVQSKSPEGQPNLSDKCSYHVYCGKNHVVQNLICHFRFLAVLPSKCFSNKKKSLFNRKGAILTKHWGMPQIHALADCLHDNIPVPSEKTRCILSVKWKRGLWLKFILFHAWIMYMWKNRRKTRHTDNSCHFIPINHDEKCAAQTRRQVSTLNMRWTCYRHLKVNWSNLCIPVSP